MANSEPWPALCLLWHRELSFFIAKGASLGSRLIIQIYYHSVFCRLDVSTKNKSSQKQAQKKSLRMRSVFACTFNVPTRILLFPRIQAGTSVSQPACC